MKRVYQFFLFTLFFVGCTENKSSSHVQIEGLQKQAKVEKAFAQLNPNAKNSIRGKVYFFKVPEGIQVVADIEGLSPGKHGFHIHESGNCDDEGNRAGAHFNPGSVAHGGPDDLIRHEGDLGNLEADEEGNAHYERLIPYLSFEGAESILDRAVIIHADPDDFVSQPAGASGARISCGVIKAFFEENVKNSSTQ